MNLLFARGITAVISILEENILLRLTVSPYARQKWFFEHILRLYGTLGLLFQWTATKGELFDYSLLRC